MKKLFQCCFPTNKDSTLTNKEENKEFKNTQNESKIEISKSEKNLNDKTFDESQDKTMKPKESSKNNIVESMLRNRSENNQKHEAMEESFTSFAVMKQNEQNGVHKKSFDTYSKNSSINNIKQMKNLNTTEEYNNLNIKSSQSPKSVTNNDTNQNCKQSIEKKDLISSNRLITDTDIIASPYLKIEEIYGDILKNNKLKINAGGLTTSLRKARDGIAFFGKSNKNGLIDFELNYDGWPNLTSYVFIIFYKKDNKKFYIKSNPEHKNLSGNVIVRLNSNLTYPITKNHKILLSEHLFDVSPSQDGKLEIIVINGNADNKDNSVKRITFNSSETDKITVGRDKNCTITLKDKGFSKIHSSFLWNFEKKVWEIKDGTEDKPSTNGTWIYAESSFEIVDGTIIEVGSSKLKINVYENQF